MISEIWNLHLGLGALDIYKKKTQKFRGPSEAQILAKRASWLRRSRGDRWTEKTNEQGNSRRRKTWFKILVHLADSIHPCNLQKLALCDALAERLLFPFAVFAVLDLPAPRRGRVTLKLCLGSLRIENQQNRPGVQNNRWDGCQRCLGS